MKSSIVFILKYLQALELIIPFKDAKLIEKK